MAKKLNRLEKHSIYLLTIAMALFGIVLILLSVHFESKTLLSKFLMAIGATICPSAIIAFVFEYYLQEKLAKQLEKSLHTDVSLVASRLGLRRIYRNRAEWGKERLTLYEKAKNVSCLAVAPNLGPPNNNDNMIKKFDELLERGVSFKFLVCHPDNPFATQFYGYKDSDSSIGKFKQTIMNSLGRLKKIIDDCENNKYQGKIEVKVYKEPPLCYLQLIDNRVYFQPYLYGSEGDQPLMLEFIEGRAAKLFKKHFYTIWEEAVFLNDFLNPKEISDKT